MSSLPETWRGVVRVPSAVRITLSRTRLIGLATAVLRRRYWLPLALAVFIGSLIFGPLAGRDVSAANRTTLVLIHLTVALTVIGALY